MIGTAPRRKGSIVFVACTHPNSSTRGGESGPSFGASLTVTSTSRLVIADERVFCQVSLPRSMITNAIPLRGPHVAQHRSHHYPARLDLNSSLALPRVPYYEGCRMETQRIKGIIRVRILGVRSLKRLSLGFSSSQDLGVPRQSPTLGSRGVWSLLKSLSPSSPKPATSPRNT